MTQNKESDTAVRQRLATGEPGQRRQNRMEKEYELIATENGRTISCRVFRTEQNAELVRQMEMMDYQNAGIKFTVREKEVRQ